MRFISLATITLSVLAFVSQSVSALPVRDSYHDLSGLSKRRPAGDVPDMPVDADTNEPPIDSNAVDETLGSNGATLSNNVTPAISGGLLNTNANNLFAGGLLSIVGGSLKSAVRE